MLTELSDSKIIWAPMEAQPYNYSQSNCKTEIDKQLALGPNEWAENLRTVEVFSHKTNVTEDVATFEQAALKIYAPGSRETSGQAPAWPTDKPKKFAYLPTGTPLYCNYISAIQQNIAVIGVVMVFIIQLIWSFIFHTTLEIILVAAFI